MLDRELFVRAKLTYYPCYEDGKLMYIDVVHDDSDPEFDNKVRKAQIVINKAALRGLEVPEGSIHFIKGWVLRKLSNGWYIIRAKETRKIGEDVVGFFDYKYQCCPSVEYKLGTEVEFIVLDDKQKICEVIE